MEPGVLLRIVMIVMGCFLFFASVYSLSRRRMTEPFCLAWGFVALLIIIGGMLLRPVEWNHYISGTALLLIILIGFCVGWGAFFISGRVSDLTRKNLELAMQVTLLNNENEQIRKELEEIKESISKE